jgi:predicted permease
MTGLGVDLRSAFRQLLRNRGLSVVALTSLAVGIGVSVSITSVSTAVLIRPLPYTKPEELVMIWAKDDGPSNLDGFYDPRSLARSTITSGMILQWAGQSLPFADFAVLESWQTGVSSRVDLVDGAGIERLRGTLATANLFDVLGVRPSLGRAFVEGETSVALISNGLWLRRFGGDPNIVGKTATLLTGRFRERELFQIVGVLPDRFHFDYPEETEIWLPLTKSAFESEPRFAVSYRVVARLRSGMTIEAATATMRVFISPGQRNSPNPEHLWLEPMHDYVVGPSRSAILLVSALTLLVLLSGAINAATVFAASTVSRLGEMRMRRALGASRARLVRQAFTESAMMAVLAGTVGLGTVSLTLPMMRALLPAGMPGVDGIRLDALTLVTVFAAVTTGTLVAGFIPAWLSVRDRGQRPLDETQTTTLSRSGLRMRIGLLSAQFALVTALLIVGGMLVRSFWNIIHVDKGFEADANVYVAEMWLLQPAYVNKRSDVYERDLLRRVRELSYVAAAGVTSVIPLRGRDGVPRIRTSDGETILANRWAVDSGYLDVMRIPLLAGRWFTDADAYEKEAVAVVSQTLAQRVYPRVNPLGKELWGSGARIVGVVADVRDRTLLERAMPAFYVPRTQVASNRLCLIVRAESGAQQFAADLNRIVSDVYPGQPVSPLTTLRQVVGDSVADRRAYAVIATAFAVAMLLLSVLGLCGHLSHVVAERTRDLAIRSALGASTRQQRQLVARHIIPALVGGVSAAIFSVYVAYPLLAPYVFEVDRVDAVSWGVSTVLVTGFAVFGVVLPTRRLSRLDAATMLRAT